MQYYTNGGDPNAVDIAVVIEDSPTSLKYVSNILGKLKFKVFEFKSPRLAVKWFETKSTIIPKVIVSDIIMPEMSGLELVKLMRERDFYPEVPILLLTSKGEKEYILEAKELKVAGYVLKPASIDSLNKKMNELFPDRK